MLFPLSAFGYELLKLFEWSCIFTDLTSESKNEVTCPDCNNVIELDWNEEEHEHSCTGSCGHCSSHTCGHEDEEDELDEEDDDM